MTVLIALGALVGVKLQIEASERLQKEQSARDIYREYLTISISRPVFARPDYCAIIGSENEAAYENYVEHLLYTAEQAIGTDPDWEPVFQRELDNHALYVCRADDWSEYSEDVRRLIGSFKARACSKARSCDVIDPQITTQFPRTGR